MTPDIPKKTKWTEEESYISGNNCPKGKEALKAIERLVSSEGRDIDPIIVRGFNQNGRWTFIDKLEFLLPPDHHQIFLANFTLPKVKRIRENNLLTNFIHTESKERLEIPYKSIEGCLCAKNSFYIQAPNLIKINGRVQLERAKSVKAPKLKEVNGDLNIRMAHLIDMPKLQSINGELDIFYARKAILPKLKELKSLKISHLDENAQEKLIKTLSLQSLLETLKSPSMSPSIQNDKIMKLIEKAIKTKLLTQKVLGGINNKTIEI